MKRAAPLAMVLAAALLLPACAAIKLSPAGAYQAGTATTYTLGRSWNDITTVMYTPKGVRVLTLDGPLLNRLYLTDALTPGSTLVRSVSKERPTPAYRSGSAATELMEFVTDSIGALGYQAPESSAPRRVEVNGRSGLQFDLTMRTADGLEMRGLAQVLEADGRLYVAVYLAPNEHYFQATLPEAQKVLASLRF